jgi:septal ring factor EnvC (AmiA/AmiB activator)
MCRTLKECTARLDALQEELAQARKDASVQFHRIAQMQAELDSLPQAQARRDALRAMLDLRSTVATRPRSEATAASADRFR